LVRRGQGNTLKRLCDRSAKWRDKELDPEGEKAREQAVKAFISCYKNNAGEFPTGVRDRAYEAQLLAAYPVHPELFLMLQADWGGLEKFQRTRGVLKMMAQIVYRLWRDGHAAPMILPGDVPLTDDKVRTNLLVPLPNGYDAVLTKEVRAIFRSRRRSRRARLLSARTKP
jgi:predicted AAA+ superfamily ATPase